MLGLIRLRDMIRRLFVLICICSIVLPTTLAWGKTKAQAGSDFNEAISTIWEGKAEEPHILYNGPTGIIFEVEMEEEDDREEILFHYDGNKVREVTDLRGYEIDRIEEDGISVWAESLDKYWDDFRVYALVNGQKQVLADLDDPPTDIQIQYPKVMWSVKSFGWGFQIKNYQYDLEANTLTSEKAYGRSSIASFYKSVDNQKQYLRAFDVTDNEYGGFKSWAVTNEHLVWSDLGGVYLDTRKQETGFKRLTELTKDSSPLTVNEEYAVWKEQESLGVYSFDEDKSYVIHSKELDFVSTSNAIIYDKKLALFIESSDHIKLKLIDVDKLIHSTNHEIETFQPKGISPHYVNGVQALIHMEPTQLVASSKYLAWTDGYEHEESGILYKKINDSNILVMPGEWGQITFAGEDFIALGRPENEYERDDDYYYDDDELPYGIYRINLTTQESEMLYLVENEDDWHEDIQISGLQSDGTNVYWYSEDDEQIISFDPKSKAMKPIDIGTDEAIAWQAQKDSVIWVEERKREFLVKYKENGKEEQILSRWASKLGSAEAIAMDGKWVAWGINDRDTSLVKLYDITTKKEKTIYNKEIRENTPILIKDNNVFFVSYDDKADEYRVSRYDCKINKLTSSGNQVASFFVQGSTLFYVDNNEDQYDIYYILSKKIKSKEAVKLSYKWTDLAKNNQQKWYDIRYSFHPDLIQINIEGEKYTWEELLSKPNIWLDAIEEVPEHIVVSVTM